MRAKATAESPSRQRGKKRRSPRQPGKRRPLSRTLRDVALPCVARCVDASHRGPGLGRSWERSQVRDHQRATASLCVLLASCGAWDRRKRPASGKETAGSKSNATLHGMQRLALSCITTFERTLSSPVPRHSEHGYSGAKRICSFQLWRYLVAVMHARSTAQPSNIGPVVDHRAARCCSRRKEKAKAAFSALLAEARERQAFSSSGVPALRTRLMDFSMAATGGPKERRPPSDYNTPPSRSSSEPFLTSLFSTTIRPSLSLFI
jgi:hypothetical protein